MACVPTAAHFTWLLGEALDTWELKDWAGCQAKVPISHRMEQEPQVQPPAPPCQSFCRLVGARSRHTAVCLRRWCLH
jgi:hypothetical protein